MNTVLDQISRMDAEELKVLEALALRRTYLPRQVTNSVLIGDRVSFTGRRNVVVVGTVEKINIKTVVVLSTTGVRWKVTSSLLSPVREMATF
tara:strand:+ start:65 stop:340 length:276 start_codon:yes stop_codon:yes gene_type:complete